MYAVCDCAVVLYCTVCFMLDPLENEMVHLKGLSINKIYHKGATVNSLVPLRVQFLPTLFVAKKRGKICLKIVLSNLK